MKITDYLDFVSSDEIQIKGHRIWIEHVLYEYIHNAMTPNELAQRFPTLQLEEIYAVLWYYHHNQQAMDHYLVRWLAHGEQMRSKQNIQPSATSIRLRQLRTERDSQRHAEISPEFA